MKSLLRRPVLAFALGAAVTAVGAGGTAAYAALGDERVAACYAPKTGVLSVTGRDGAPATCAAGHLPIDWSIQGPQGPQGAQGAPGVFGGTLTSPNGAYSLSVTDSGIVLSSTGASVRLTGATIEILSSGATTVQTGTTFALAAGTTAALQAGTNLALASGSSTTVDADRSLAIQAGLDLSAAAGGALTLETTDKATLKGAKGVLVESATGQVTVKGAKTLIQASGENILKGSPVEANSKTLAP
jgi:hypothetical protein